VTDFLQEFKLFQHSFATWMEWEKQLRKLRKEIDDATGGPTDTQVDEFESIVNKFKQLLGEVHRQAINLDKYNSILDVYAPESVREAFQRVDESVLGAVKLMSLYQEEAVTGEQISAADEELDTVRKLIANAVRQELNVKTRRHR
jgi:predicted nucleotidyltransferase